MKTCVFVVRYRCKVFASGESPPMFRICEEGRSTMKRPGRPVDPGFRNSDTNQPKPNCPNRQLIRQSYRNTKPNTTARFRRKKSTRKNLLHRGLRQDERAHRGADRREGLQSDYRRVERTGECRQCLCLFEFLQHAEIL